MSLKAKIILLVILIVFLGSSATSFFAGTIMLEGLEEELKDKGRLVSHTISGLIAHHIIDGEAGPARDELIRVVGETKDIAYAYIIDFDGRIFAHTFEGGFPRGLFDLLCMDDHASHTALSRLSLDGVPVMDVEHPLVEGMDAHVHIGMDESGMYGRIKALNNRIYAVTAVLALIGIALGTVLSNILTTPLSRLTESIRAFGEGGAGESLEASHASGTEVSELTNAFNHMVVERKKAEQALTESESSG
jgi:methyl-accepting chemotaxis protein